MKNSKNKTKKPVKKYLFYFFCLIILITTILLARFIQKRRADRTVRVAFYGLSEEMREMFKGNFPEEENIILEFDVISDTSFDAGLVKDKYDMIFTWKGEITDTLAASAQDLPANLLEVLPFPLRNKKCAPILLDHCEFAFSKDVMKKLENKIPETFTDFNTFLEEGKSLVFSPVFCTGGDDRLLIDFVGANVMAKGGLKAYNRLIEELRKAEKLENVLDINLDGKGCTLRSVLEMLKALPDSGLMRRGWYDGQKNDLLIFAEDKQLGCFFTLLSEHRKISYNLINKYDASYIPSDMINEDYGLIAPSVCCMLLSDNSNAKRYLSGFLTREAQKAFSEKTKLAPAHSNAQACDIQADDVRFWAASNPAGAVPDLYYAVYQRKSKELTKICSEIRSYVR